MNICYISNSALPSDNANSLQIIKMCENFKLLGNNVVLILPNTGFNKSIKKFYDLKTKINIVRCNSFKKFPLGINYYLFSIVAIIKSLKFSTDIYVTRNYFCAFLLVLFGKKIVFELHHDLEIEGKVTRFLTKYLKFLKSKNIKLLVAITKSVSKYYYTKDLINKENLAILPSASDLNIKYAKQKKYKKNFNIGYFGNFYKSRGSDFMINLAKNDKTNNYYIYSKFQNKEKIINKKINNIYFNDFVDRSEIKKHLKKMDILILPYQKRITVKGNVGDITKYTSPLKLFDYLAAGKLIICSEFKVLKEIIQDRKDCILIKNYRKLSEWIKIINFYKKNIHKKNIITKEAYLLSKKYTYYKRASLMLKLLKN